MSNSSFLTTEYQACFEQLRYYDTRQDSLLKYLFNLTTATATAQFAVLQFLEHATTDFFMAQGFLFLIVFTASLLLYVMMLQNRVYFVFIARQINAIRNFSLATEVPDFTDNQLYTSTSFSAFKLSSLHTMQMFGSALISALFAAVSTYGILHASSSDSHLGSSILVFAAIVLSETVGGALYLNQASRKTSDDAVHKA